MMNNAVCACGAPFLPFFSLLFCWEFWQLPTAKKNPEKTKWSRALKAHYPAQEKQHYNGTPPLHHHPTHLCTKMVPTLLELCISTIAQSLPLQAPLTREQSHKAIECLPGWP